MSKNILKCYDWLASAVGCSTEWKFYIKVTQGEESKWLFYDKPYDSLVSVVLLNESFYKDDRRKWPVLKIPQFDRPMWPDVCLASAGGCSTEWK